MKEPLRHAYYGSFSDQVYRVAVRLLRYPVVYRILTLAGETLRGLFYEQELRLVSKKASVQVE